MTTAPMENDVSHLADPNTDAILLISFNGFLLVFSKNLHC